MHTAIHRKNLLSFRKAMSSDIENMFRIQTAGLRETHTEDVFADWTRTERPQCYLPFISQGEVVVVEGDDKTVVGFGHYYPARNSSDEHGSLVFIINYLFIDLKFTRQGIGSKLLKYIEEDASRQGAEYMVLHAILGSVPFYVKHGYAALGLCPVPGFEHLDVQCRKMTKSLEK